MKDKSIKQPWPRSAKITVWVLGILLFIASAYVARDICIYDPDPVRVPDVIMIDPPKPSCFPVVKLLADTLKDQRTKHPKDFPPPKTQDEEFIKDILDADNTVEYLKSVGY